MVTLHGPKHKAVATVEDVLAIRRVLEHTKLQGAVPQQIVPYAPHGFGRHLRSDTEEIDGKREPERKSFYEAIAATLRGADRILFFGHGTGESSAMEQLIADLKHNHSDVAKHIVGSIVVDGQRLTEGQLRAEAREFFASKGA